MLKKIRFYQIPWSHYCDKVRWALDIKGIPYETVNYSPWGKTDGLERVPKSMRRLFPIIEDPNADESDRFKCDSTTILLYLDEKYPGPSKPLFPVDKNLHQQVIDSCLQLDSSLGLYARRLVYTQILLEKPSALAALVGEKYSWGYNPDDIRSRFVSPIVGAFMIARYRMHRIREDQLREKLETILLDTANHLQNHDYLVGDGFTAADLTFCSLTKPLVHMPCFSNDQRFATIFAYYERIRQKHDPRYPDIVNVIEKMAINHRLQTKLNETRLINRVTMFIRRINIIRNSFIWFMQGFVNRVYGPETDYDDMREYKSSTSSKTNPQDKAAKNDQMLMNAKTKWSAIKFYFKYICHYFFTIPQQSSYLSVRR